MTDFMRWLYAHYIAPQLEKADPTGYENSLSLMEMCLDPDLLREYRRTLEFYAGNAFLLGLYTGAGLQSSQNSFGSTQPSI
ncbi:MAG: hypothetical protein K2O18_11385 [Oscillospiraceae bacterium]|nr:hypothetical protein [Oscillospiraceae bacterium]